MIDWAGLANVLAERSGVALVLLDRDGRILTANTGFERIVGHSPSELEGRIWMQVLSSPRDENVSCRLFAEALAGRIDTFTVAVIARGGDELELTVETRPIGAREEERVLAIFVVRAEPAAARNDGAFMTAYLVQFGEDRWLLQRSGAAVDLRIPSEAARAQGRCYEVLYGRDSPCVACPIRPDPRQPHTVVRASERIASGVDVVTARLVGPTLADVTVLTIPESTLGAIHEERLARLATRAKLSDRERAVLALLAAARTPDEIAETLGISTRTVKFHQQNVLQKLGADSRFDLLRLLF